jgi:hypothetical protein
MRMSGAVLSWPARAFALLGCAVLLAGCASMPSSGEVSKVSPGQHADSQVRVYGVKPQKGETPDQIVRGFLEATTSDEATYGTARLYLAPGLRKSWNPYTKITVLQDGPLPVAEPGGVDSKENSNTFSLSGHQVGTVDGKHAYQTADVTYQTNFHLSKVGSEWRIDGLDDGLVLSEADFQRIYQSVNMYYFAQLGPDAVSAGKRREVLVPDPVYLRGRIDLLSSTVKALLGGPTNWLDPVVDSAFPDGASVKSVSLDDSQRLNLRLNPLKGAAVPDGQQCMRMAAQLFYTVQGLASSQAGSVEVQGAGGEQLCSMGSEQAQPYAPSVLAGPATHQFYIDTAHRLVSLYGTATTAERVLGPFGEGQVPLGSVAVRRDETFAAGVKTDGRTLYVAGLSTGAALGQPVLRSAAKDATNGLSAPSWDGYGNLWVADRDPARPRLLMLRDGAGTPVDAAVPDLGSGRIESLRVAADGVRIALVVRESGHTTLRLGRIERSGTQQKPQIKVAELRLVTPQLEDVKAASWAGASRLVVVGNVTNGVQQIQYVDADGSASYSPTLQGDGGVASVAASENQSKPLLAELGDGIFQLPLDADWKEVTPKGSSPVYPG